MTEAGYLAVALLGTDATEEQLDKLESFGKLVIVGFDNDTPGKQALARFESKLVSRRVTYRSVTSRSPKTTRMLARFRLSCLPSTSKSILRIWTCSPPTRHDLRIQPIQLVNAERARSFLALQLFGRLIFRVLMGCEVQYLSITTCLLESCTGRRWHHG
jgi:hypothetical protein